VAVLLVLVIFLCGVASIMAVMNIRLVNRLSQQTPKPSSPLSFAAPDATLPPVTQPQTPSGTLPETEPTTGDTQARTDKDSMLSLHTSPTGIPNKVRDDGLSLQEIYENTINSVVSIACTSRYGSTTGTGVILTADGYVVTNAHVIEGAAAVEVILQNKQRFEALVVGSDSVTDLAVLKISAEDLSPASLGDSGSLRVGDTVVAIGDPLGLALSGSMTDGIVSAINRDITVDGRTMTLIQTNAALNSGNSGGPLINCYGQVVGINTMKIGDTMSTNGVEGLGFAIPSSTVKEIVTQLISLGYVSGRPTLGIRGDAVSSFYQVYFNLPVGLYITELDAGSDAAEQGIRVGDILLSINNTRITSQEDLEAVIYQYAIGDTVEVVVYRSGRQGTFQLTVQEDMG
jgi:serine protease Do